jgi:hypothetical protein
MNLIFAFMWLVVSLVLFALPWIHPRGMAVTIGDTGLSAGWFGLLLCLYNLVRWWVARVQAANQQALREDFLRRHPPAPAQETPPYRAPDPTFDFSEPAPPGPAGDRDQRFQT